VPRVVITQRAAQGLEHCRQFLADKNPQAAVRAGQAIEQQVLQLENNPDIGRPLNDLPELRELVIEFGDSGYAALYRHLPAIDTVVVFAFRHQKEAGYQQHLL